jgi:protein-disulfide isomerase
MPNKTKKTQTKKKFQFVYFIIFSIIVLLIFAVIIIGSFWDYWAQIREMENYYKERLTRTSQAKPQINQFDPIKGSLTSEITLFEYSDFFCPACQKLQADLESLEKLYGNNIRFVFKSLPITVNPENRPSLNAAYCAWEQNKFWEYKKLLYQEPLTLNKQKYRQYANQLNLNLDTFNQCLDDNKYYPVIEKNITEALNLNITSIPTVFINDQRIEGFVNYNSIKNVIDQQLQ